jgi:hypothetical protein
MPDYGAWIIVVVVLDGFTVEIIVHRNSKLQPWCFCAFQSVVIVALRIWATPAMSVSPRADAQWNIGHATHRPHTLQVCHCLIGGFRIACRYPS